MIFADKISFKYDEKRNPSLDNINLNVSKNEFIILAGESGSGKSTLLKAITGIIPGYQDGVFSGNIENQGWDTVKEKIYTLSHKTGILFQNADTQFFNLSVEDEICFGMLNRGWSQVKIDQQLEETIELFDLQKVRKLPPSALSEGQKQRTVLASILATKPDLLLLDEPFAHLDHNQTDILVQLLQKLKALGTTIIIAEHRFSKLIPIASRVIIMQDGKIIHDIQPEKLNDAGFTESLGLRNVSNPEYLPNPLSSNPEKCIVGVKEGNIAYRSGFRLGIEAFYADIGKKIALLGPNGSGKSSMLKVLSGLKKLKKGRTIPKKIIPGKHSALVYQQTDNQLFMESVEEEILQFATCKDRAMELLNYFSLSKYKSESPFSLSEGEKQRVVLAATLSRGVPVLLLDEPTTGMDGRQLEKFIALLNGGMLAETSCIIATHDNQLISQGTSEQYIINSKI
jgi:energy-coupling factor transport system ATP-binding protein